MAAQSVPRKRLYEALAADLTALIREGALKPGERIPSVREISRERGISAATVIRAYERLEGQGFIVSRPRSGFFVSHPSPARVPPPRATGRRSRAVRVDVSELVFEVLEATRDRKVVAFGSAFPSPLLYPLEKLASCLATSARRMNPWSTVEHLTPGNAELRNQIARRYLRAGAHVSPDEIIITSGALEALGLCLQTLTRPGDLVAIETPAFYGCLQAIEALSLKALEIPTHAADGIDLAALTRALDRHPIRVCWFMTSFQNPMGGLVPGEARAELVRLLNARGIPLIEDDVYAELYFGSRRPTSLKAFDHESLVLNCGSFSKSLAPGYRVGWVAAGRFAQAIGRRKVTSTLMTSIPIQNAIALYLREGGYDRHLGALRRKLAAQQGALLDALHMHLPQGVQVTRPEGGYFVWLELSEQIDSLEVYRQALEHGISTAPGPMFSARRSYGNCLRLNYGHEWTHSSDAAIRTLSQIVQQSGSNSPQG